MSTTIALKTASEQEFFEELGAPCGFFSFSNQTSLGTVSLEQSDYEFSQKAKVLRAVAVAELALILLEHDVQDPVHVEIDVQNNEETANAHVEAKATLQ